jgi:hypothetical protein
MCGKSICDHSNDSTILLFLVCLGVSTVSMSKSNRLVQRAFVSFRHDLNMPRSTRSEGWK